MGLKSFIRRLRRQSHPTSAVPSPSPPPSPVDLRRVFEKLDTNGDGRISSDELSASFSSLVGRAPSPDEIRSMMSIADSDGDGFISLQEYIDINTLGVGPADETEDLRAAFSVFDIDGSGSISAWELAKVMGSLGEKFSVAECRRMIGRVDRDGDGMISFDEFREMMTGTRSETLAKVPE